MGTSTDRQSALALPQGISYTRIVGLGVCFGLMLIILALGGMMSEVTDARGSSWLLALGFVLLGSFLAGAASSEVGLPRVTGYLLVGAAIGPQGLALITPDMIGELGVIKGLAVALIALNAGGELKIGWLRQRIGEVFTIFAFKSAAVVTAVVTVLWLGAGQLTSIPLDKPGVMPALLMLVGLIALANSPMVAIALINENQSKGPLTQMVLAISIFKDVLLVVAFTIVLEICRTLTGDVALGGAAFTQLIGVKLFGSILFGVAVGWVLALYGKRVGVEMPFAVVIACFFIALLGDLLHLKPLLAALAAGCFIENYAPEAGDRVIAGIRRTSLPVYCLFFALAGVELHLDELTRLRPIVGLLAGARLVGNVAGCRAGCAVAGSDPVLKKYLWAGLLSQAGLSLAMASIIGEAFAWGSAVATLLIAMIVVNEVGGPIVFNWALKASGEAGAASARAARA